RRKALGQDVAAAPCCTAPWPALRVALGVCGGAVALLPSPAESLPLPGGRGPSWRAGGAEGGAEAAAEARLWLREAAAVLAALDSEALSDFERLKRQLRGANFSESLLRIRGKQVAVAASRRFCCVVCTGQASIAVLQYDKVSFGGELGS
ncbi:unnamed protein product, partial [Effrenium voratum]